MKHGAVLPRKKKKKKKRGVGEICFSSRIIKTRPYISIIRLRGVISKKASNFLQIEMWLNHSTQLAKYATWSLKWETLDEVGKLK